MHPFRRLLPAVLAAGLFGGAAGAVTAPAVALNDPLFSRQWGLSTIGAPTAWNAGLYGEGVDIAIVDTGVHLGHQEFRGRLGPGRNFVSSSSSPQDDHCEDGAPDPDPANCARGGHGTHVAGIAAAGIDNGGSVGVAPRARVMPVKVLDEDGSGSFSDAAAAIRWSTDNGAEVINLSLGSSFQGLSGTPTVLNDAVSYAWSKGVICVFAAGNSFILGSGFSNQPALVVSATNRQDGKPDFSSGVGEARWALAAPGGGSTVQFEEDEDIWSTVWVADNRSDTFTDMRGTSMAAPFVAGAAALLRAAGLTPQQTVDRLLATAKDVGPKGPDSTFGQGRLDVAKAVQGLGGAAGAPTTTAAPAAATTPGGGGQAAPATTAAPRRTSRTPAPAPATTAGAAAPSPGDTTTDTAAPAPAETLTPADPDDGFFALPAEGDDETPSEPAADGASGPRWPWVAVALAAALGVGGTTGWLLWRRRGDSSSP